MLANRFVLIGALGLMFVVSFIGYYIVPADGFQVPWYTAALVENEYVKLKKWALLGLLPILAVIITIIMIYYPRFDPHKNLAHERGYKATITSVVISLFLFHAFNVSFAAGWIIEPFVVINLIFGLTFVLSGNYLTTVHKHPFFGVITPWTLNDDRVWLMTQRFAAKWSVVCGIFLMFIAMVLQERYWLVLSIVMIVVLVVLVPYIYSFISWKTLHRT